MAGVDSPNIFDRLMSQFENAARTSKINEQRGLIQKPGIAMVSPEVMRMIQKAAKKVK